MPSGLRSTAGTSPPLMSPPSRSNAPQRTAGRQAGGFLGEDGVDPAAPDNSASAVELVPEFLAVFARGRPGVSRLYAMAGMVVTVDVGHGNTLACSSAGGKPRALRSAGGVILTSGFGVYCNRF